MNIYIMWGQVGTRRVGGAGLRDEVAPPHNDDVLLQEGDMVQVQLYLHIYNNSHTYFYTHMYEMVEVKVGWKGLQVGWKGRPTH
jgi:hypothetical protein